MVDVGAKTETQRTAVAHAFVGMSPEVLAALPQNKKGDPLEVARIAGIMAAKKTSELIPLCHQIPLSHVSIEFEVLTGGIRIRRKGSDDGPNRSRDGGYDSCSRRRSHHL